jgi:Ser/Thr protein kinase RdoA (MazF antagonist)
MRDGNLQFQRLNQPDLPAELGTEAERRVLARLGDDIALIAAELQLRPTAVTRLADDRRQIIVRLTTPGEHVVVRIAPAGNLATELMWSRALEARHIPTPRVIAHDLSRTRFPFAYLVEAYVGGQRADRLLEGYQLRAAGRQLGRLARQIHAIPVPGWGQPTVRRGWSAASWTQALTALRDEAAPEPVARVLFGAADQQTLAAVLHAPASDNTEPRLLHGALGPHAAIVTSGEQTQLVAVVAPGLLIGGDPLWDVACALDPAHPQTFRDGFSSGYLVGALDAAQQQRLLQLRLLHSYLAACRRYVLAEPHEANVALVHALLAQLQQA